MEDYELDFVEWTLVGVMLAGVFVIGIVEAIGNRIFR